MSASFTLADKSRYNLNWSTKSNWAAGGKVGSSSKWKLTKAAWWINFSSESWTDSKYLSRTGLESLIQTSCGSGRKSLANTDPIAKFQQRWTLSGEKCIQSSTLEKFTKFHIKVIPVCGFQQSPCRKTHQSSRVESSQRQGHSKVETKCSGGVTQSYSLKVTRFKWSNRPCKLSVEKCVYVYATQICTKVRCTKVCFKISHMMQKPGLELKWCSWEYYLGISPKVPRWRYKVSLLTYFVKMSAGFKVPRTFRKRTRPDWTNSWT